MQNNALPKTIFYTVLFYWQPNVTLFCFFPDSMSYVWGVAFSKDIGAEKSPRSNSARFVSAVYAFLALIIVNTYCANLMAFLVQESPVLPISGIRDEKVHIYSVYR